MAEQKIFILGGYGEAGKRLADYLLARTGSHVIIAGRNEGKAQTLADHLNHKHENIRASAKQFDASQHDKTTEALGDIDFFIQAGPALATETVHALATAVIDVGADWMDVQVDPGQAEILEKLEARMIEKGCCFATQGGFHPGLPGALVRYAANRFDSLETADTAGYINPEEGLIPTSGVDELINIFRDYSAEIFENGVWREARGADMRKFVFGFGIGPQSCAPMSLDEMKPLPGLLPTLRNTGFYVGGFDWFTNYFVIPLIMFGVKVFPWVTDNRWGKLMCWSHKTFNRPPYGTSLELKAIGIRDRKKYRYSMSLQKDDEYELTAIPMVATIEQMLDGSVHRPGLHRMALLCNPMRLIGDMGEMGVKIVENESILMDDAE